jgi:transcription elongation factor GreB
MSKAFTKDDAPQAPLVIPPRAPLPPGTPNYVTARGIALLRAELAELEAERARLNGDERDPERARKLVVTDARIADLAARIATASVVDPRGQPRDRVRFGATVTLRTLSGDSAGEERRFVLVGVDEAAPAAGRVAFLAPIARAIMGLRVGDTATLRTPEGEQLLEVAAIED